MLVFKLGDRRKLTNYKPISILSCFSKILEKRVHSGTIDFLNYNSVLCPTHYEFRPKQSTVHATLNIVSTCFDNVENEKFTGLLQLVLTKAFDTVQQKIFFTKLNHYSIRRVVNNYFELYLTNRSQTVIIHDNHSLKSSIDIWVPQGSFLGPLSILYLNDLPNCISSTSQLFADDTCILVNRGGVEDTRLEAKAKDQGHRRKGSPEKGLQNFFRRSQKKGLQNFFQAKKVFKNFFSGNLYLRKPKKRSLQIFRKVSGVFQRNFNGSKIVLSSSRGQFFSRT